MSKGLIVCKSDFISDDSQRFMTDKLLNKTKVINLSDYIVTSQEIKHNIMDL